MIEDLIEDDDDPEGISSTGKSTVKVDSDILDDFKQKLNQNTYKDIMPVVEAVLLAELDRSGDAEDKKKFFRDQVKN